MVQVRLSSGGWDLDYFMSHFPKSLPPLPPPERGARAREPELSLRHLKWGLVCGEGLPAGPTRLPCPSLHAGLCIAGAYLHCNIHVPAL